MLAGICKQALVESSVMDARLPDDVSLFFAEYLRKLEAALPGRICGCYLYGSIALGAYDPVKSDIDFLTVVTHRLEDVELNLLREFHGRLRKSFPLANRMEGQYVPLSDIVDGQMSGSYPSVYGGEYQGLQGVMTLYRYQLHEYGVRISGPEPAKLFPMVSWELVRQEMESNINGYWLGRAKKPLKAFLGNESVEFAVLTLCRILYTLEHRQITTKTEAGEWALETLPARWTLIVQEGLRIRTGCSRRSLYDSRWQRGRDVREFILATREWCCERYFVSS